MLVLESCHVLSRAVLIMRCFRIAAVQERRIAVSDQESFLKVSSKACFSHGSRESSKSHFSVTMTDLTPTVVAVHSCMGRHQSWWVSWVGRTPNNADCCMLKNRHSGVQVFFWEKCYLHQAKPVNCVYTIRNLVPKSLAETFSIRYSLSPSCPQCSQGL